MNKSSSSLLIMVLLVIAAILSYVDRGNLSVVVPEISKEFQVDEFQIGWLFSAFFWSYCLFQVAAGWVSDRYDVKWVFAGGFLLWTLATLGSGMVWTYAALLAMRLLLGIGESVVYPCISRILLDNFEEDRRGLPNALIAAGTKIGPAISILLGGLMVERWGWRPLFIATGLVSLVWLIPWTLYVPSRRSVPLSEDASVSAPEQTIRFSQLLQQRAFWGTTIGFFCLGYSLYFLISWLPAYLETERHFPKAQMAIFGSLPFALMATATVLTGWLSDWAISRGVSPTWSRLSVMVSGFSSAAVAMYAIVYVKDDPAFMLSARDGFLAVLRSVSGVVPLGSLPSTQFAEGGFTVFVLVSITCIGLGMFSACAWAVTQTLAGPAGASKWSGLQNALGNLGGVFSPVVTGWIVRETGSYRQAFVGAAAALVVGTLSYLFLVGKVAPVQWDLADTSEQSAD